MKYFGTIFNDFLKIKFDNSFGINQKDKCDYLEQFSVRLF